MWEGLLVSCLRSDHSPEIHLPRGLDKCCCLLSCLSSPLACTLRWRLPISLTVQPSGARFCKRVSLKAQDGTREIKATARVSMAQRHSSCSLAEGFFQQQCPKYPQMLCDERVLWSNVAVED